jgi:hypothetical protein
LGFAERLPRLVTPTCRTYALSADVVCAAAAREMTTNKLANGLLFIYISSESTYCSEIQNGFGHLSFPSERWDFFAQHNQGL